MNLRFVLAPVLLALSAATAAQSDYDSANKTSREQAVKDSGVSRQEYERRMKSEQDLRQQGGAAGALGGASQNMLNNMQQREAERQAQRQKDAQAAEKRKKEEEDFRKRTQSTTISDERATDLSWSNAAQKYVEENREGGNFKFDFDSRYFFGWMLKNRERALANKSYQWQLYVLRAIEYDLGWKVTAYQSESKDNVISVPIHPIPFSFARDVVQPLEAIVAFCDRSNKRYHEYFVAEAAYYLGILHLNGYEAYGDKLPADPAKAMSWFEKAISPLRNYDEINHSLQMTYIRPAKPRPSFFASMVKKMTDDDDDEGDFVDKTVGMIPRYQHSFIAQAAYELMRGYRDGIGVARDEAKVREVAALLTDVLAPLHGKEPDVFKANLPARQANPWKGIDKLVSTTSYADVADFLEPALSRALEMAKTKAPEKKRKKA